MISCRKLVNLIKDVDFNGVSGRINFRNGRSRFSKIQITQWYDGHKNIIGYFTLNLTENGTEISGGHLDIYNEKIIWLSGKIPEDGTPPCKLFFLAKLLDITCTDAIIVLNVAIFLLGVLIVFFCGYKYKQCVDAKSAAELRAYGISLNRKIPNFKDWEIPRERVVINRKLGRGAFGIVYGGEAKLKDDKWIPVAVKTLQGTSPEDRIDFISEAEIMKGLDHPNIVKLLGVCTKEEPLYTIMEFMLYGDLKTYLLARRHLASENMLDENNELTHKKLTTMALDIAKALAYLTNEKLIHRDVACRNCMVNSKRVVKLGDFGMTRTIPDSNYYRFNRRGMLPVRWMAPESLSQGIFTLSSDIWGFGVLLYEIITLGNFPFADMTNDQVFEHVVKGNHMIIPDKFELSQ